MTIKTMEGLFIETLKDIYYAHPQNAARDG
jgi:hypothetical protein